MEKINNGMEILFTLLAMFFCLVAEGFFSGSEIGVVSSDRLRLRHEATKGSKGAKLALQMLEKPEWLLSTTLIGTNLAVVTNTTLATALVVNLFGGAYSWLAIVFVAPLIWLFGEIVPKSVFQQRANEITPKAIFILRFCSYLFYPILVVFSFITRLLTRALGGNKKSSIFTLREQIISMLHLSEPEGDVSSEQSKIIHQMLDFSEMTAVQVMIPLVKVVAVDKAASCGQVRMLAAETGLRKLAVFDQRIDNIVGMIHSLELLGLDQDQEITPYIRPVKFVSGAKVARELLEELRHSNESIAAVVNEFGGARGIITISDLMHSVVFDFHDEFSQSQSALDSVQKLNEKEYLVDARMELIELYAKLGIKFKKGDYSTLAGYLLHKSADIPTESEQITSQGITYTIEQASPKKIETVKIKLP